MIVKLIKLFLLSLAVMLLVRCTGDKKHPAVSENDSELIITLPVFVIPQPDSIYISDIIQKNMLPVELKSEVLEFYIKRNYQCAWFNENGLTEQAGKVVNMVGDYIESGIIDTSMFSSDIRDLYAKVSDESFSPIGNDSLIMVSDISFTAQFLLFSKIAWRGIDSERVKKLDWFLPVKKTSEVEHLAEILSPGTHFISGTEPVFKQYLLLKEKLKQYREIQKAGGWEMLPELSENLNRDGESELIADVKRRLSITGNFIGDANVILFDSAFADAIISVREQYGLLGEAVIDNKLISKLNVPVETRIRQMLLNLERWKWIPPDPGKNFIVVNIPEFMLHVIEEGKNVKSMKVIVGKSANQTVIFSGDLKHVVLSPYWVIPRSIIINETFPAIKKNRDYITKHHMEIFKNGSPPKVIDPSQIDWNQYTGSTFPYSIRQKPGETNSLGYAKFLFPNEYSIYLHDTPARDLFSREGRTFSHGCIRIAEPKWLATYLLRNDSSWTEHKIDSAMLSGKEKYIILKETIPVYITYFTSWVDSKGRLNFRNDIYGHDRKLEKELFENP